ncbi:C4-dicarboxylate ABC transporter [Cuniculiplasma sp. SKW3]|uniref:SLAC1 family transporter n=1 Tax=Cuniculiplasma sp. SKW3 TaxID=3400170 RepID=UPI003FCF6599
MNKSSISLIGSEWFGIPIATLALAEVYILIYGQTGYLPYSIIGEIFTLLGISIFLVVLVLWIARALLYRDALFSHWNNLTRLSFVAIIPIIGFVSDSQLIYYFGISSLGAELSLLNYGIDYSLALLLGVLLGFRLYTKKIEAKEMNYAIVIPPLAIGTSAFLAPYLIKFYGGGAAHTIYYLTIFGLGIFFMLYIFIGSLALAGHVANKNHQTLPTTMLPVGIASLAVINILTLESFNSLNIFLISSSTAGIISLFLWGFEVWNFLVVAIIILSHPTKGNMSVWAYGFPLGLFAISTLKIMSLTNEPDLLWLFGFIALALNVIWVYAWYNTYNFITNRDIMIERIWEEKIGE